jgi:hypothetical protein
MNAQSSSTTFLIGRDLGPAGRAVRILAAGLNLAAAVSLAELMGGLTSARHDLPVTMRLSEPPEPREWLLSASRAGARWSA